MTTSPALKMARDRLIFNKLANEKEEEKAREKAHEAMKFNAEQAERAAGTAQTMTAKESLRWAKATIKQKTRNKPKAGQGRKNYTNAKGYPRKAQSYGDN